MIEICRSHLVAAFPSAMDCLYFCSVREYGRFAWLFVCWKQNKTVWAVKNGCVTVGRSQFNSKFLNPVQSICPEPGDRSIRSSRCDAREANKCYFWGGICFIIWNTRGMFSSDRCRRDGCLSIPVDARSHTCGVWVESRNYYVFKIQ